MNTTKTLQLALIWMACIGTCCPSIVVAGNLDSPTHSCDAVLQPGGQLTSRVVDAAGNRLVGETLAVFSAEREIARVTTDQNGRFVLRNLRSGVHQIVGRRSMTVVRLWSIGTAPPSATHDVLLVDGSVVRGQCPECEQPDCQTECVGVSDGTACCNGNAGCGDVRDSSCYGYVHGDHAGRSGLWSRPLLIGGVIAAAIAIPVAVADDDDHDDAS